MVPSARPSLRDATKEIEMTKTRKIVSTILLIGALGLVAACGNVTFKYPTGYPSGGFNGGQP